jgi:hypothetical protein
VRTALLLSTAKGIPTPVASIVTLSYIDKYLREDTMTRLCKNILIVASLSFSLSNLYANCDEKVLCETITWMINQAESYGSMERYMPEIEQIKDQYRGFVETFFSQMDKFREQNKKLRQCISNIKKGMTSSSANSIFVQ